MSPTVVGATIGGGGLSSAQNRVVSDFGTVGGGSSNRAGYYSVVGGGMDNTAFGSITVVGGGLANTAIGNLATVAGGEENKANGYSASVGGGALNEATGFNATIPGGEFNLAAGAHSFAAGRNAKASHDGAFVWADSGDADFYSGRANQFAVRATGGISLVTAVDVSGNPVSGVVINDDGLETTGRVAAGSLRVSRNGTTLEQVVAGTATIGPGSGGVKVYTVTLPVAFELTPNVVATPRSDPLSNTNDTFVVTVRKSATTYFVVNVYRVDVAGGSWSQNLLLDWMAWH